MFLIRVLAVIGMPLAMAIGGIVAWRQAKHGNDPVASAQEQWKDTSLDDWRKEREAQVERERQERLAGATGAQEHEGTARTESEQQRHQRLGG
jgi:hypothetical protein